MTVTADADLAAPGWRRDPGNPRHITYWDGARWTVHMHWDGSDWQRCREPHEPPLSPVAGRPQPLTATVAAATPLDTAPAAAPEVGLAAGGRPPAPARRRRRRLYGLLGLLVLVAGAAGGFYIVRHRATAASSGPPPATTSAAQVLDRSFADARSRGSVHAVSAESAGSVSLNGVYDLSTRQGQQTITGGAAGTATVVATPGAAYVKADAAFLQTSLGLPATTAAKAAGTWIVFRPSDTRYRQIVAGVTLGSALAEATPTGTLHLTAPQVLDGQQVVGIAGGLPGDSVSGAVGRQVLYVAADAPYLPVELDITGSLNGQSATSTVTFSQWGEPATVSVPSGATPASVFGA